MQTALLFDLDLTLVEYDPAIPGIFATTCESLDLPADESTLARFGKRVGARFTAFRGDPFAAAVRELANEFGWSVRPERFAARLKRAELDAMYVSEGVHDALGTLAADHPIAVVTNGYGPVQRRKLDYAGLSRFVDVVVTPTEVGVGKPDPRLLRAGADALPADRYVVVGDSVRGDLDPACELGFECVLVGNADDRAVARLDGPSDLHRLSGLLD
ncbi:HAD family hydrolase [Halomarina litorea]|uniref:HAD family hydrolase n=1 Tax=Halomarina litorea TaxID=2961595 RepID=UPI0020C28797|nr:HAD family hydrolase [Halomarina sp. BCD28]